MKRFVLLLLVLAAIFTPELNSQSKDEQKDMFYEAESWILFEDYQEALPLYQQLLNIYPGNSNFKYRIGQCYLNIPGEKEKAAGYLEEAVRNINPEYKSGRFRETKAPYDALYFLANAYRINNQLDKAIETYGLFKKNMNTEVYDSTIIRLQIESCHNAKKLINDPSYIKERNLGSLVNENTSEFNPVVSDDESLLVFSRSEAFYDAILSSGKSKGTWGGPVNLNEILRVDEDYFPTSLSKDGRELYLYSSVGYDGNIYISKLENGRWSPPEKLNDNINTKFWESHATISHDNKRLYFTSNRNGGLGGLDIYVSLRENNGDWGIPYNLGTVINTPYNEETPFLSDDDKTLYFSSRGHFNMGGYDVFYSKQLPEGQWSRPENYGYPLNSTDDDIFFFPVKDGFEGYYAKYDPDGFGRQDIYRIEIFSDNHPRTFTVIGMARLADIAGDPGDKIKITTRGITMPDKEQVIETNPKTGEYETRMRHGVYEFTYEADGGESIRKIVELPVNHPSDTFLIPGTVLPKTDFVADLVIKSNRTIVVNSGNPVIIPLGVELRSVLDIGHWYGNKVIRSEKHNITGPAFNYSVKPLPGNNKILFRLTDRFNNTTAAEVFIIWQNDTASVPLAEPEYLTVISPDQIKAFRDLLRSRADDNVKTIIDSADFESQQFAFIDDVVSFLKGEASMADIDPEVIDKLALEVALRDNVLTQAAVDLMDKYAEGELKTILGKIDIYGSNLKTWSDLQNYVYGISEGRIKPEDLDRLAEEILAEMDPDIAVIREKILVYSNIHDSGDLIKRSVTTTDARTIKKAGRWLQSVYSELLNGGMTSEDIAGMFAIISSLPGTEVTQYIKELSEFAEEPLLTGIRNIDLKANKIKSPKDLIEFLLRNKEKYPDDLVFSSLAKLIASRDIPSGVITQSMSKGEGLKLWHLLTILGIGLLVLIIWLFFRKRDKKDEENDDKSA